MCVEYNEGLVWSWCRYDKVLRTPKCSPIFYCRQCCLEVETKTSGLFRSTFEQKLQFSSRHAILADNQCPHRTKNNNENFGQNLSQIRLCMFRRSKNMYPQSTPCFCQPVTKDLPTSRVFVIDGSLVPSTPSAPFRLSPRRSNSSACRTPNRRLRRTGNQKPRYNLCRSSNTKRCTRPSCAGL